jgi:acetyl esterase/lipase
MTYVPDPELAALQHSLPRADLSDLPVSRELERQFLGQATPYEPHRELTITNAVASGGTGSPDVCVRIFVPTERTGPLPGLLYLRPSGFVMGNLDSVESPARRLADHVDVAVIAVDYRIAPEHPYPAALDDSYAALRWATSPGATAYGIDPDRVAVLGDSAGGGLAAALSMLAKDRKGPALLAQFLDAPTIDDRCDTPSMAEFTDTPMWRGPDTPLVWQYYLGDIRRGGHEVPRYAAPARASVTDLAGLPPTWMCAYQLDPTRDEVLRFADRLLQADVPTELHHYAGAFHMSHTIPGTAIGARILSDKFSAIRRILASAP